MITHLGRPEKGGFEEEFSLLPLVAHAQELIGSKIKFTQQLLGSEVEKLCDDLQDGELLLLENIRFYKGETTGDMDFARQLSELGDVYINDAFGSSHRDHVSTSTLAKFFPNDKYFGFLMEYEVTNLQKLMQNPKTPFTSVVGGSKVSSKINILKSLLNISDNILIGGGMVFTFFKALGQNIGNSLCEDDKVDVAINLLNKAAAKGVKIWLPIDIVVADKFSNDASIKTVNADEIPDNWLGMDIANQTAELYSQVILDSKTVLWNGPMGVFEMDNFTYGTKAVAQAVAQATEQGTFSTIGGGDSVAAINKYDLENKISFVSTGGGAMLEYIENGTLVGIEAILNSK
jgi:phosphoglycerate kinase